MPNGGRPVWKPSWKGATLGPEQEGLIISHFGRSVDVEALEAPEEGQVHRCHLRANLGPLVTGDRVVWRAAGRAVWWLRHVPGTANCCAPTIRGS